MAMRRCAHIKLRQNAVLVELVAGTRSDVKTYNICVQDATMLMRAPEIAIKSALKHLLFMWNYVQHGNFADATNWS